MDTAEKSNYSDLINSIAHNVLKNTKKKTEYDKFLDSMLTEMPWYKDESYRPKILLQSKNANAIFDMKMFKQLLAHNDMQNIDDFYYYASYYAMYKDVYEAIEKMERE